MTRTRKTFLTILLSVFMSLAVWLGAAFVVPNKMESTTAQAASYTTKDVAMMGRVAGWYGNGNFEIRFTLGEADWSGSSVQKSYVQANDKSPSSLTAYTTPSRSWISTGL